MSDFKRSMLIEDADNVVVAVEPIQAGERTLVAGEPLAANEFIKEGHKIARTDIEQGAEIIKYGVHIGVAVRPIKKGDWVLVTTKEGGAVARRVNPMPHLMPGVVILGQGNWRKIDQQTGVDVGANANTLCKSDLLGDGYQSYNSNLVKIERYVGEELLPEYKRAQLTAGL